MKGSRRARAECGHHRDPVEEEICTLPPPVLGGVVMFTSTESRQGAGSYLASFLLRALARLDPRWGVLPGEDAPSIRKGVLGRPCLLLGDREGPSLSFSHGEGRVWAAMSGAGGVGIDVAGPEEFADGYPLARAFRKEELDWARDFCRGDTARGAALLWAVKEASVKATGFGFNHLDPLEVRVGAPLVREQGVLFEVLADRAVSAWTRAEQRGWLSVALASG
ncbi:MAG: 4'-phosphopantetheinyl transferase superfamily protein [Thermodesulfobacteriota bacterium]